MRFRSHSRRTSGLPMDWHERRTIGGPRRRPIGASGWFLIGLSIGIVLGLLSAVGL